MREPAELRTTEDAGRSLPSHGPDWDAAIAAGIDVTMIEANLQLRPCERLRRMEAANRFAVEVQARTLPAAMLHELRARLLREKVEALGPEREE